MGAEGLRCISYPNINKKMHLHELEMHFLPKSELDCIDASEKSYTLAVPKHFYLGWGWGQSLVNIQFNAAKRYFRSIGARN